MTTAEEQESKELLDNIESDFRTIEEKLLNKNFLDDILKKTGKLTR